MEEIELKSLKCAICLKDYTYEIIYSYGLNCIACIPCIKKHSYYENGEIKYKPIEMIKP